jgi:hypothetical protein
MAAGMHDPWRRYLRYSPKCVEVEFSEVELRADGVLRSALHKDMLQLYLLSREPFTLSQGRFLRSF